MNARLPILTTLAMVAFAANSLLCRAALGEARIDAASFTTIRLVSGALTLWLIVRLRGPAHAGRGSWPSALALLAYAALFSLAYASLTAATGALLLFAAVQATMIGHGLRTGERLDGRQWLGLLAAAAGLAALLWRGLAAPPLSGALLMAGAGIAWGVYSLRGRGAGDPVLVTAGNFLRAAALAALLSLALLTRAHADMPGIGYAVASGVLASGVGYAIWYAVLPALRATHAATVQLSVPVIAALGGVLLLDEPLTPRLALASAAILGGIALVMRDRPRQRTER
ncbi:MAG: hypothetical protein BGO61_04465 [Thiobacillus sp. 65-69]|nr:MAG: hypothetical protein ABT21_08135 [Thiobacillus sp. SCN 65-179]OJW37589.1 MAG: hypothetical protein BGO61_04465 [Thiobacillus sp. 65-69]